MATSLRDLLERTRLEAEHSPATIPAAQTAITALGHLSRALQTLAVEDERRRRRPDPDHVRLTAALAQVSGTAAAGWPPSSGRLPDLAGAAADVIGRLAPELDAAGRWAVAVALAETARHCADAARRPPTYRRLAPLTEARAAAAAVEQHATADPPATVSRMVLDRLIPVSNIDAVSPTAQHSIDAAAGLVAAVRVAVSRRELTVGEAVAVTAAARVAARHATEFAGQLARQGAPPQDWEAAAAAWHAVQLSYSSIDDGTKHVPPATRSPVIAWAVRLHDELHAHLATQPLATQPPAAPASATDMPLAARSPRNPGGDQHGLDQSATALRAVVNQLPELARLLDRATESWTRNQSVYAPHRRLASYEQDHVTVATGGDADRVVAVKPGDLADTISALRDAERLSTSLSAELDRTSDVYGHQPQPYLAAAHRAATAQSTPLARARRAQTATRRAGATQPSDWTLPPRPARGR